MPTVGIIVNPAAGKDIRRLVASASPSSDVAKIGMARRAVIGAIEGGAVRVLLSNDRQELARRAIEGLDTGAATVEILDEEVTGSSRDTTVMAQRLWKEDAGAVVVMGGDGTHRDVARGWLEAPVVAVSVGTNNVFPQSMEATVAGHAAGRVASGVADLAEVAVPAKVIHARFGAGEPDDLALVEVALVDGAFIGSRAVWNVSSLRSVVAAIAEPTSVGLSAIAAAAHPVQRRQPGGVRADVGPGGQVHRAPVAPGLYADVAIETVTPLADGVETAFTGPGVVSFDGERDRVLRVGSTVELTISGDGPRVIDVGRAMGAVAPGGG